MSPFMRLAVLAGVDLALCAAPAGADTVFLTDGTELTGEVQTAHRQVTVRTEDGVLTLPAWRVARVESPGGAAAPSGPPQREAAPAAGGEGAVAERPVQPAAAGTGGPPRVQDVLASRMSVDFDGVPLHDALAYIHEVTGVNMALSSDVGADTAPIYLHVKQVRLETILELVLKPRGFVCSVRPGEILYVSIGPAGDLVPRVYEVTDLLLSTEDRGTGQAAAGGQGRGTAGASVTGGAGGLSPQFTGASRNVRTVNAGGNGRGAGYGYMSSISSRAENLVFMIKGTCGPGTWMDPTSSGLIDVAGTAGGRGQQSVGGAGY